MLLQVSCMHRHFNHIICILVIDIYLLEKEFCFTVIESKKNENIRYKMENNIQTRHLIIKTVQMHKTLTCKLSAVYKFLYLE